MHLDLIRQMCVEGLHLLWMLGQRKKHFFRGLSLGTLVVDYHANPFKSTY